MKRTIIAVLSIILIAFAFTACRPTTVVVPVPDPDTPNVTPNPPVTEKVEDVITVTEADKATQDFVTDFIGIKDALSEEHAGETISSGDITGVDLYTKVASVNGSVSSVSMFGKTFEYGDTITLDINNNAFYEDRVWYVDNGSLYLSNLGLFQAIATGSDVVVDGTTIFDFPSKSGATYTSVAEWADNAPANCTVTPREGTEFDVQVSVRNVPMYSWYDGQSADDIILGYVEYQYEDSSKDSWKLIIGSSAAEGEQPDNVNYFYGWGSGNDKYVESKETRTVVNTASVFDKDGTFKGTYSQTFNVTPVNYSARAGEDGENNDSYVKSISFDPGTGILTITADVDSMTAYESATEGQGTYKWIPVLFTTGFDTITENISVGGVNAKEADVTEAVSVGGEAGEFVYWVPCDKETIPANPVIVNDKNDVELFRINSIVINSSN